MLSRLHTSKFLMPLFLSLHGLSASAMELNPVVENQNILSKAIQVRITPKGMKYFDNRMGELLGNLGIKLDEGYFPAMSYSAEKEINPDDLSDKAPESVKIYKQVRDLLNQWLIGFSMKNHRPTIEIGESGYVAQFSRFGLVTDEKLMKSLGKADGAVLAIELEVKKMTISTQSVVAWDLNNEFLGKVGMENVTFKAGDNDSIPLKIRLPFYVRINAYGLLEFQALEIENNFSQIPLAIKYEKLLLPVFAVEINGQKFYMNNKEVDKLFEQQTPLILEKVRENLEQFAREQLPELLNTKAKEAIQGSLQQVQDMLPPGQEDSDTRPNFKWGMLLQAIHLQGSLNIELNSYVEDPINSRIAPAKSHASRGSPQFSTVPQSEYDIALSVDRSLINRVLQLSFERKNFENIQQSDGSVLRLKAVPLIDYVKTPKGVTPTAQETYVKLKVAVENKPDTWALKDTIIIGFDIVAKIRQLSDKSGMQLVLHSIDTESMILEDEYFSFMGSFFKEKVRKAVKEKLTDMSAGWIKKEETIPGSLPIPPEILGLTFDIHRVVMDSNGHLVMFLNYAKRGAK
ncbi:MAG: hypothetical protein AAGB31_12775 [Bdellovibrio sp.]